MKKILIMLGVLYICFCGSILAQNQANKVYVGIIDTDLGATSTEILEACRPFEKYISERLNINAQTIIYGNVPDLLKNLKNGTIQFAYVSNLDYIHIKKQIDVTPLAKVVKGGSSTYKAVFMVRSDSNYNKLDDLKGKKFAYTNKYSAHGYIYPSLHIKSNYNMLLEDFFSDTMTTKKDSDCILAVLYKKADVASISDHTFEIYSELKPSVKTKLKSIQESPPFVLGLMFYYDKNIKDKTLITRIKKEILNMENIVEGKQILLLFRIGGWTEASDADYNNLRKIFYNQ